MGKEICQVLSEAGAIIAVADIMYKSAETVAAGITSKGGQAISVALDISDEKSIDNTFKIVNDQFKQVDILINNAAIDVTKPIENLNVKEIGRIIDVNLKGTFLMCKYATGYMYGQRSGEIVNIASTAALRAWPETTAYHATKWGIRGLSHALFTEARKYNVKVSVVIPGGMKTPFLLERFPDIDQSKLQDPRQVAEVVKCVLSQPDETIIPEVMVLPLQETSWP